MDAWVLVQKAIEGIEAGTLVIRPGLSKVLWAMSRIAPQFMFKQMSRLAKPNKTTPPAVTRMSTSM
jgi:uncharacterized oxidoreductase